MLTVAKVTASAAGGYAQYLEGRSQAREAGDYYLSEQGERVEAPGRWLLGERGAEALVVDVERAVEAEAFQMVMAVRHPESGEALRRVGGNGEAVCAIDATFSAPKSVSVVWALASPELRAEIEACQERAVDRAVAYATAQVEMTRRRLDQQTVVRERATEVLASSWRHTTARAVAGRAPDPQLHSHTLIHGAIRADGELVAVDSRSWFVHQREIDAAYLSELAQGLERLGFAVERETGRRERYFELAGVPEGLRERFSGRHAQVHAAIKARLDAKTAQLQKTVTAGGIDAAIAAEQLEVLERSGRLLPGEERSVAMQSRAVKVAVLATAGDLDRVWWQDAQPFGFDARTVEQLRHELIVAPATPEQLDARVLERLTEFEAVFTDRDVRAAALVAGVGLDLDQALRSVDRLTERGELVVLADGRLTTRGHRAKEVRTVARARVVAAASGHPISVEAAEREVAVLDAQLRERGFELAGEQAQAIRVACGPGQLTVIEGQAGTGKSTALQAIARAHEQGGQRIVVTSTAALAAERLADELLAAGVDAEGFSTAALERQIRSGSLPLDSSVTVVHDEAALASTREHDQLLGAVEGSGARLILVGDPRQSRAVGASGLWERIEQAAQKHDGYVALERIVRARDPADRRDQALWRSGQHDRALAGYDSRDRLILEATSTAEDRALESAQADREAGRRTLVVSQTSNERLDALNARAQAIRAQAGELGDSEVPLAGRPYGVRAGDEVQIRHPVAHPELGRVSNGTTGKVLDVDAAGQSARLALSDGREAVFAQELLDQAQVRLAYVQHPFPAQGVTVDTGHVIVGEHATAEGSYVALTRARQCTHLYAALGRLDELGPDTDRETVVAALAKRMGRSEPEIPSIALPVAHEQRVEAEHARETRPSPLPEQDEQVRPRERSPRDEVAELREQRDRLVAVLATYPTDVAEQIKRLQSRAGEAYESAAGDRRRAEHWQHTYDDLGLLRRRSQDGRRLKDRVDEFTARASEQQAHGDQLDHQAQTLASGPGSPGVWEQTHPGVREQLHAAETALAEAVDRRTQQREARPGRRAGERSGEQARWLEGECDRLREQLRSYPHRLAREAEQAEQSAEHDAHAAADARARAQQAEQEYWQLGRWARRGARGTQAQERQHAFGDQAERYAEQERAQHEQARQTRAQAGGPVEWDRAHPGVRERLAVYERAHTQAAFYRAQELVEIANPARALGPRPAPGPRREVWEQAARAIAGYRDTYNITDQQPGGVLGQEPRTPGRQHQEWTQTVRQVLTARQQLGNPDLNPERGLTPARPAPAITPHPGRDPSRGPGFGR